MRNNRPVVFPSRYVVIAVVIGVLILVSAVVFTMSWGNLTAMRTARAPEPPRATVKSVFDSPLAGTWYPGDKTALQQKLDAYLARADVQPIEPLLALIMPHAGYAYSGEVAAYGIKAIKPGAFKRVIVMGPSHRLRLSGTIGLTRSTHYRTPLGEVPVDLEFLSTLERHEPFRTVSEVDESEHSVQIQLPLLQHALGEFQLVPLVVGQLGSADIQAAAGLLLGHVDVGTLVIASSDFTHYGPRFDYVPFQDDVPANIEKLDMGAWDCIKKKDGAAFADYVERTGATICGHIPIRILLAMLPKDAEPRLLKYDTSGRITGDTKQSVSYLSAAWTGAWRPAATAEAAPPGTAAEIVPLTDEDKEQLLKLARLRLETFVKTGKRATPETLGISISPAMKQILGAFVTIKIKGELRGCIGEIFPRRPLYEAVMDRAIDAGVRDPRFPPVTPDELPLLEYEVSALTQPRPVDSYTDIVIGKHGMTIEKDGCMAVFLPQVAPEQGWDRDTTLTHLARKAGLPGDAWKQGAAFQVFEAIVFHERV